MAELMHVDGLADLEANLKRLRDQFGVKTGGIIIRGMKEGMRIAQQSAKRLAPSLDPNFANIKFDDPRTRGGRARKGGGRKPLIRSNIVVHPIPTNSPVAGGRPTVIMRVRNRGYQRHDNRIFWNQPGSSPGYWWWVEFGTRRFPARPFLRPAFERNRRAVVEKMREYVKREIEAQFSARGQLSTKGIAAVRRSVR